MRSRIAAVLASILAWALVLPAPAAHAAFPGANGKLAVETPNGIAVMNPDGTGQTVIVPIGDNRYQPQRPKWSPDGKKLLYQQLDSVRGCSCVGIWSVNADGTGVQHLIDVQNNSPAPTWSPDGSKIAFTRVDNQNNGKLVIAVANADGSSPTPITSGPESDDLSPNWSPDGSLIAFYRTPAYTSFPGEYVVKPDGTGLRRFTSNFSDWSPDGSRIAFLRTGSQDPLSTTAWVANADASNPMELPPVFYEVCCLSWSPDGTRLALSQLNPAAVTVMGSDGSNPTTVGHGTGIQDWQPIPIDYPHPRGAGPSKIPLVPAYQPCAAPNSTHGAPLSSDSCSPPAQSSTALTVGTPDANGQGAKSIAVVYYRVRPGNPATPANEADVKVSVAISDVRYKVFLTDYTGELQLASDLRLTDRDNTPNPGGPGPATVTDTALSFTVPCTATADTSVGSSCNLNTTVDAVYPGLVQEGNRAIWELGQVKAYDGGVDGLVSTAGDNTLFMDEGIFVP